MKKIENEYLLSLQYELSRYTDRTDLVELTAENVARVEFMIRNNSRYAGKNNQSATDWLEEFAKALNGQPTQESYEKIVFEVVSGIDRTNSTHINADGVGREELTNRIVSIDKEKLYQYLKNPQEDNYKLIEILSTPTHPVDPNKHARSNYSFATKFCHYTAFHLFKGETEQDNFSIYDSIVAQNIGKYADYYGIKMPNDIGLNYTSFITLVDDIIKASGDKISRNGFDHLLWYVNKKDVNTQICNHFLIHKTQHCALCHTDFEGIAQFNVYCCESCGTQHVICPTCMSTAPTCPSCNGHLLTNDDYIEKYGITDIYGNHIEVKGGRVLH